MTEQEAKALASELAHHKDWRVSQVLEMLPGFWAVYLAHRHRAEWVTLTVASLESVRNRLATSTSDVTFSINLSTPS